MPKSIQIRKKCEHCLIDSASIEVHDSSGDEGVAMYAECSFCHCQYENGELIRGPNPLHTPQQVQAAFESWMRSEGHTDLLEFCRAHFEVSDVSELIQKVLDRQPIESNFDVLGYLFSGMMGQADPGAVTDESDFSSPLTDFDILYPTAELSVIACALTSVMMADGSIEHEERQLLNAQLQQFGVSPLDPADQRVWRPSELAYPSDPQRLIEAMVELAFVDKQLDGSEWQVIREYARHWRCDLEALEVIRSERTVREGALSRLFSALRHLFFEEAQ